MAKKKAKKKSPNDAAEQAQIKFDLEGEAFLWNGMYYVNMRTGMIAPTRIQQILDDMRLKGEAK